MIQYEIVLNDKVITNAGSDNLCVLSAIVNATGKLGDQSKSDGFVEEDFKISLSVTGLTSKSEPNNDEQLFWINQNPIKIGDEIKIRIIENITSDNPIKSKDSEINISEIQEKKMFEISKKTYLRLRDKYESK